MLGYWLVSSKISKLCLYQMYKVYNTKSTLGLDEQSDIFGFLKFLHNFRVTISTVRVVCTTNEVQRLSITYEN